jgi:DNA-binding MarR family transcriptional regulator
MMSEVKEEISKDRMHKLHAHLVEMAEGEDIRGMQISQNIRVMSKLFDMAVARSPQFGELSGARMGILIRLYMEAEHGNAEGVNPTTLGHFQDVKKNTISALLKGLEEAGLVDRSPHPTDRRASLVRISAEGRKLVRSTAPLRFRFMNEITSGLSSEEQDELIRLLKKLRESFPTHLESLTCKEIN